MSARFPHHQLATSSDSVLTPPSSNAEHRRATGVVGPILAILTPRVPRGKGVKRSPCKLTGQAEDMATPSLAEPICSLIPPLTLLRSGLVRGVSVESRPMAITAR